MTKLPPIPMRPLPLTRIQLETMAQHVRAIADVIDCHIKTEGLEHAHSIAGVLSDLLLEDSKKALEFQLP